MANELELVRLEHTSSGHSKQYTIWIEKVVGGFVVNFSYGKINGNAVSGTKTNSPRTWGMAMNIHSRLQNEKFQKGYHVVKAVGSAPMKPKNPILMVKAEPENFVPTKKAKMKKPKPKPKKDDEEEPKRSLIL